MPNKKKYPLSGLSQQQKDILKYIYDTGTNIPARGRDISKYIAEKYNKNESRITYRRGHYTPEGKPFKGYIHCTDKHYASMSRSLKRLRERGLIKKSRNKGWYDLTDKGLECKFLELLNLEAKVVDIHKKFGNSFDVYIGRRQPYTEYTESKWANPYLMDKIKNGKIIKKRDGTAKEVVEKYRKYLLNNEKLMNSLPELRGKILGCWCKNQEWYKEGLCHGDVLIELLQLQ